MSRLVDYVRKLIVAQPSGPIKIVILEDTRTNIDKARAEIRQAVGPDEAQRIQVKPIWAGYSRYAKRGEARAQRDNKMAAFEQTKRSANAIDSFNDLMDVERFGPLLKDAHVIVDFDGVLSQDETRRVEQTQAVVEQTQAVYDAIVAAGRTIGISEEQTRARLEAKEG